MTIIPRLLTYKYSTYCQGTEDVSRGYVLVYGPDDASFTHFRSLLFAHKHQDGIYEIDLDSVTDLTIK